MPVALFVTLNVVDAFLTKTAISAGAAEFNPLMTAIGGSVLAKGGIALALVFLLYYFRQRRALWFLNGFLLCVVLWNLCVCCLVSWMPSSYAMFGFRFFG